MSSRPSTSSLPVAETVPTVNSRSPAAAISPVTVTALSELRTTPSAKLRFPVNTEVTLLLPSTVKVPLLLTSPEKVASVTVKVPLLLMTPAEVTVPAVRLKVPALVKLRLLKSMVPASTLITPAFSNLDLASLAGGHPVATVLSKTSSLSAPVIFNVALLPLMNA